MVGDILQPTHLIFILVVALLVLGPKRLPEVGRQLGNGLRDFRAAINGEHSEREESSGSTGVRLEQPPAFDEPAPPVHEYSEPLAAQPNPPAFAPTYSTEPAYAEPAYTEPVAAQPAHSEPAYPQPVAAQPAHSEPAYPQPVAAQQAHTELAYPQPAGAQQYHADAGAQHAPASPSAPTS